MRLPLPLSPASSASSSGRFVLCRPFTGAVDVRGAARPVRAGLELHVQLHAGGRIGRRRAAGRDAHLLEHVEVVVGRRAPGRREIRHRNAVEIPGVLGEPGPLGEVVGLLAGFRAADVDAIDDHPGHRLQHDPGIARRRQLLQLLVGHAGRDGLACGIDDRGLAVHLHRLGHAADLQRRLQRNARSRGDAHGLVAVGGESRQRDGDARRRPAPGSENGLRRWYR